MTKQKHLCGNTAVKFHCRTLVAVSSAVCYGFKARVYYNMTSDCYLSVVKLSPQN